MSNLHAAALALGGRVVSGWVRFAPPGHSLSDDSGAMRFDPTSEDGIRVKSFSPSDDPSCVRDFVRARLGIARPGGPGSYRPERAKQAQTEITDGNRVASALSIWHEAGEPRGTRVQAYLHSRGLDLPGRAAGAAVRFHPDCPFAGTRTPAMVCLVRDVRTNEPKAIQRTAISKEGYKVKVGGKSRLALGPTGGGAIKLTPDEDVTLCLGVGEGVETALSLHNLPEFGASPVWSLISASGVETFPVLPGIESLWIAVDHDVGGTGQRVSRSAGRRWQAAGAEVFLKTPSAPGADLNDIFTAGARDAS